MESGPPGKGSTILVPQTGGFAEGQLMPGECVSGEYKIGQSQRSEFECFVGAFGIEP